MKKTNLLGLMLATSLTVASLAGCVAMPSSAKAPAGATATGNTNGGTMTGTSPMTGGSAGAQSPSGQASASSTDTAAALAEERDAGDYSAVAESNSAPAAYSVQAVSDKKPADAGATLTADVTAKASAGKVHLPTDVAAKLATRAAARLAKAEARIGGAKDKIKNAAAGSKWVDNGDGTSTKTLTVDVDHNGNTRHLSMVMTKNAEGVIVSSSTDMTSTHAKSGVSRTLSRSKTVDADGVAHVSFTSSHTFKNGDTRAAAWTKSIAVDGTVTGTGTITWTGTRAKTLTLTLDGTEDAPAAEVKDGAKTEKVKEPAADSDAADEGEDEDAGASADTTATATT